jgi:uncharacterized protein (TIGR02217 family)
MAFYEKRFPVLISRGAVGGPGYDNEVVAFHNGREVTISNRNESLASYDVAHGVRTIEEFDLLMDFFRTMRGKAHQYRFEDPFDSTYVGELLSGTPDGIKTQFGVQKNYGDGTNDEIRRLYKLRADGEQAQVVYDDGVPEAGVTIDQNNGIITFSVAPLAGHVLTMDGSFDTPARFDTDQMKARWEDYNARTWGQIPVVEVIPDGVTEPAP